MHDVHVGYARPDDAPDVRRVIHRGFGARRRLDPPTTATDETDDSVRARLEADGGVLVRHDAEPVAACLFDRSRPGLLGMRRVSVDPAYQQHGVASVMVGFAEELAGDDGLDGLWLTARVELPETVEFWQRRGYFVVARRDPFLELGKALPVVVGTERPEDTVALGQRLAALLAPGDLLVLAGGLGAGKTTLARGIGAGLGVRGDVTSPTFVIARVHPPTGTGPALVHADAYRLGGVAELDDLDLDASLASSVTVVEWGSGVAEGMSASWLEVRLDRRLGAGDLDDTAHTDAADGTDHPVVADGTDQASGAERLDPRTVTVVPHGSRWSGVPLRSALLTGPA